MRYPLLVALAAVFLVTGCVSNQPRPQLAGKNYLEEIKSALPNPNLVGADCQVR